MIISVERRVEWREQAWVIARWQGRFLHRRLLLHKMAGSLLTLQAAAQDGRVVFNTAGCCTRWQGRL